jgi:hypothetical protein
MGVALILAWLSCIYVQYKAAKKERAKKAEEIRLAKRAVKGEIGGSSNRQFKPEIEVLTLLLKAKKQVCDPDDISYLSLPSSKSL